MNEEKSNENHIQLNSESDKFDGEREEAVFGHYLLILIERSDDDDSFQLIKTQSFSPSFALGR